MQYELSYVIRKRNIASVSDGYCLLGVRLLIG
jgi:hypothetical protein